MKSMNGLNLVTRFGGAARLVMRREGGTSTSTSSSSSSSSSSRASRRERSRAVMESREKPFGWWDWKEALAGFSLTGGVLALFTVGAPLGDMLYYKWKPQTWEESARMPEFQGDLLHWPYPGDKEAIKAYMEATSETGSFLVSAMKEGREVKVDGGLSTTELNQVSVMSQQMVTSVASELVAAGVPQKDVTRLLANLSEDDLKTLLDEDEEDDD